MMFGGFIGGVVGDRMGRRVALLGSLISFGVLTLMVPLAGSPLSLSVLRFLAGLGLGAAMPNAATLSSEYVPTRHRPFAVTLTIVCIPLGGSLAGFVGGYILPRWGWHTLFIVCGLFPLVLAVPAEGAPSRAVSGPPQGALAGTGRPAAPPGPRCSG